MQNYRILDEIKKQEEELAIKKAKALKIVSELELKIEEITSLVKNSKFKLSNIDSSNVYFCGVDGSGCLASIVMTFNEEYSSIQMKRLFLTLGLQSPKSDYLIFRFPNQNYNFSSNSYPQKSSKVEFQLNLNLK